MKKISKALILVLILNTLLLSGCMARGRRAEVNGNSIRPSENNQISVEAPEVTRDNEYAVPEDIRQEFNVVKGTIYPYIYNLNADESGDIAVYMKEIEPSRAYVKQIDTYISNAKTKLPEGEFKNCLIQYYKLVNAFLMVFADTMELVYVVNEQMSALGPNQDLETLYTNLQNIIYTYYDNYKAPDMYATTYENLGTALEMQMVVLEKVAIAAGLNDMVRYNALLSYQDRAQQYTKVYANVLSNQSGPIDEYVQRIQETAGKMVTALESAMDNSLNFRYAQTDDIAHFVFQYPDEIYPQQYSTYDSILIMDYYALENPVNALIEVEIPGFTQKYSETVKIDEQIHKMYIKPPVITGNPDLSAAKEAQLCVTVTNLDTGAPVESHSYPITIKSRNDFNFMSEEFGVSNCYNLLCLMEPEAQEIAELKRLAVDELIALTGGGMNAMAGYQRQGDYNDLTLTAYQAIALQCAMSDLGVRYIMDPYSVSGSNQRINLPSETMDKKSGLCVETALVMASALQSLNMHALLILPPGHCQVAVETWAGSGEYLLIETTLLPVDETTNIFFDMSQYPQYAPQAVGIATYFTKEQWALYLQDCYVIDCDDAISLGLTGLPK